ncbi:MAG: GGDEF domain-containing protein [Thermosipho sp. (in: Bacteria)]|nr:GGDEF domain-containing protein [Thermosipho sp. (in: thermotogales)]
MECEFERRIKIAYIDSFLLYILQSIKESNIDINIRFKLYITRNSNDVPENLYRAWRISKYYFDNECIEYVSEKDEQKLVIFVNDDRFEFDYYSLIKDLKELLFEIYTSLSEKYQKFLFNYFYDGLKVAQLLRNVSVILNYALRPEVSMETIIYAMLTGITAGYGGAFNRCFMLVKAGDEYRLFKGLGPTDKKEAHDIWETIETIEFTIEDFLKNISEKFISKIEEKYKNVKIKANAMEELLKDFSVSIIKESSLHESLKKELEITTDIAILPIRIGDNIRAVLIADNKFDRKPINKYQILTFEFFGKQLSMYLENKELFGKLKIQSLTDPLTGLENRRALEEYLEQNNRTTKIVAFIDINDFKKMNDTYGHEYGDVVLKKFAGFIRENIRKTDRAFRYGGDEFVIVLDCEDLKIAQRILERIKKRVFEFLKISFAVGIVKSSNLRSALKIADQLVYKSKNSGNFEMLEER